MKRGTAKSYRVFVWNWWRRRGPRGELVPDHGARKTTLARRCTELEAQALCREFARTHAPGPLERRVEYDEE